MLDVLEDALEGGKAADDIAKMVRLCPGRFSDERPLDLTHLLRLALVEEDTGPCGSGDLVGKIARELRGEDDSEPECATLAHDWLEEWRVHESPCLVEDEQSLEAMRMFAPDEEAVERHEKEFCDSVLDLIARELAQADHGRRCE